MVNIPAAFQEKILHLYGSDGWEWLAALPDRLQSAARRWSLDLLAPLSDSRYHLLLRVREHNGPERVLKAGFPGRELLTEIAALKRFRGPGTVRLIRANFREGLLLLESIHPGTPLTRLEDDLLAAETAAELIDKRWIPAPHGELFPTLGDWCRGLRQPPGRGPSGTFPNRNHHLSRAQRLAADLLADSPRAVLLHGDLHQGNILKAGPDTWRAVDPKGVIGEPAAEIGPFMINPSPDLIRWPDLKKVLSNRLAVFTERLALDPRRLWAWSYIRAVLAAAWSAEEESPAGISYFLSCADQLLEIAP